jgi:hypothetical protein
VAVDAGVPSAFGDLLRPAGVAPRHLQPHHVPSARGAGQGRSSCVGHPPRQLVRRILGLEGNSLLINICRPGVATTGRRATLPWLLAEALAWGCTVAQAHQHQWRLQSVCCCGLQQQGVCMLMRCARGHFTCTHLLLFKPGVCVATSGPFWTLRCSFLWSGLRASRASAEGPCCPQPQSRLFHAHISWHEVWSSCPSH